MKQFNLSEWLKDKSRKVVTRDGREARILCIDCGVRESQPILVEITCSRNAKVLEYYNIDGTTQDKNLNLFFADEEPQSIEIPFGAKDSEFIRDEYLIPEGCEARIEGNKVIIEKIQKNEDERIRKELIYFLVGKRIIGNDLEGIDIDKTLSWLEKQGESKFKVGDWIRYRDENYNIEDIEMTDDGFIYNVSIIGKASDPEEVKTSIGFRAEKEIIKIEQFAWSEEDEKNYQMLQKIICDSDMTANLANKLSDWLKSLKPSWKPTEQNIKDLEWCAELVKEKMGVGFHRLQVFIDKLKNI